MVRWTVHALAQLRHINGYIADDSPLYAKRVTDAIVRKTVGLDKLPYQGRKVPELNEDIIRELPIYSYRIIYEMKMDAVEILAVIHKRQDFSADDLL
jgi:plasmid stabilization system protein ParE